MRPWIRRYNYIEDYFHTVYEYYISHYPAYPVNYYSLDFDNSIYDDDMLLGGSYEKTGVGELSGIKFKKIISLPVFGTQAVQPSPDSAEDGGLHSSNSMMSSVLIPQIYDLKPVENDVLDINFGFKNTSKYTRALFIVTNVNLAHHGDQLNLYYLNLQIARFEKNELEKQISSYWQFYEPTKKILKLKNANLLTKITVKAEQNIENLKNCFDEKVNLYLEKQSI
jgi:hypothetical protein